MRTVHHIEAPIETVFEFFADPRKSVELFPDFEVTEAKVTEEGTGTYASYRGKLVGLPFETFSVLTEVVPNKHITEKSASALAGTWEYDFEPEGTGTKLTMEHHSRSFWALPGISFLNDLVVARMNEPFVLKVKEHLEKSAN